MENRELINYCVLVDNFSNLTSTYRTSTFADSETKPRVQCYWVDQLNCNSYVITRHYHFCSFRQSDFTCTVHSTQVELRTVFVVERSVTTTFFFLQNVDRSFELRVRFNLAGLTKNHTTFDFVLVDTTEQQTYVVTSFTLIQQLAEHFNTSYNRLLVFTQTEDFNFVTYMDNTSFDTTSSYSTTTSD